MFRTLLESRAVTSRRTGGTVASALLHVGIISALIVVTANATRVRTSDAPVDVLHFAKVDPPARTLPATPSRPPTQSAAPANPGFNLVVPSIDIPSVLPSIDFTESPSRTDDFSTRGDPNALTRGASGGMGGLGTTVPADGIFSALQVDRPVMLAPGVPGPSYPETLRAAGIDGTVLAQFVVDTLGRVDVNSVVTLRSDHALFAAAVRAALGRMRFLPAEAGGRKVRQLVQQSFQFSVTR